MRLCLSFFVWGALAALVWGDGVVPVPTELTNAWPADWEAEFRARGERVLQGMCAKEKAAGLGGRTYFENEKRAYGFLMAHLLAGDKATAIKELQKEDAQAKQWHAHTEGIDYYACFTLKHQMRKYFLFGHLLDPAYKKRMYEGAKAWTSQDPLRRPHPAFVKAGEGWGPDVKNSWVDVRSTENLFLMRVTSVYLMAEETGNEATRQRYRDTILKYTAALYRVGMGEWDSENYHGHSLGPLLNLFDFAKDMEVKAAAKACLDYMCAIGAVKYYRGAFNGPTNRDYNHSQPFGGSAACMLWLYFGDSPRDNQVYESDEVHVLSSGYRPPVAVVQLARKAFDRPVEILASKPNYTATTGSDYASPPEYLETQWIGQSFQLGSLVGGTTAGKTAVNGFKIAMLDSRQGANVLQGVPGPDPRFAGSAKYIEGKVPHENRIGQYANLALWLVEEGSSPWVWVVPESVAVEQENGITFLRAEKTSLALHPIHTSEWQIDEEQTRALTSGKEGDPWKGHRVLSAKGKGGAFCGVALEIGESPEFDNFRTFKQSVIARAKVHVDKLAEGEAAYTASNGKHLRMRFGKKPLETHVWRDHKEHSWTQHAQHLYHTFGDHPIIEQSWMGGSLTVRAGGSTFHCRVNESGMASFDQP